MAERYPTPPTQLDTIMNEINETFDSLILQLNNRRQTLLDEVRALSEEMAARKTQMKSQAEDLTAMQASIQVKLRHNEMRDAQERMLAEVNQQLDRLDLSEENEFLSFKYSEVKLIAEMHSFGSIVKRKGIIPNYSNMKQPIIAVGKIGTQPGEINDPYGVAFCDEIKQIFIADYWNQCIQIFTEDGLFMKRIECRGYPRGVAVYKNSLYVTDNTLTLQAIILYKLPECTLVKSVTSLGLLKGKFNSPSGLTVSNNGDVFIADEYNNRIVVMDGKLVYKHQLKHTSITEPIDVKIHDDTLFILCKATDPAIQVFSMQGSYLYSVIARQQVEECPYFCMDIAGNIIMSDGMEHKVKIFDRKGALIHVIGKEGHNKGEFSDPRGIAVTNSGKIITISQKYNFILQIYK